MYSYQKLGTGKNINLFKSNNINLEVYFIYKFYEVRTFKSDKDISLTYSINFLVCKKMKQLSQEQPRFFFHLYPKLSSKNNQLFVPEDFFMFSIKDN